MPQAFPPLGVEYEAFLYAVIGDDANGMVLTMNSVIARSGADPWAEAARLARLPKAVALDALARLVPNRDGAETTSAIAARLLALLPTQRPALLAVTPETRASIKPVVVFSVLALLLCLAVAAGFSVQSRGAGPAAPISAPTSEPVAPPRD